MIGGIMMFKSFFGFKENEMIKRVMKKMMECI